MQLPLQLALVKATVAPYVPAGHALHTGAPASEYCPAPHIITVPFVDAAGQEYPATQSPLHCAVDRPDTFPYLPAGQSAIEGAPASV